MTLDEFQKKIDDSNCESDIDSICLEQLGDLANDYGNDGKIALMLLAIIAKLLDL